MRTPTQAGECRHTLSEEARAGVYETIFTRRDVRGQLAIVEAPIQAQAGTVPWR